MKKTVSFLLIVSFTFLTTSFMTTGAPSLHYLVRQPRIASPKPPLIILLHGVGSNEEDLFSLAGSLPDQYLVVSARAPLTVGPGSYAWFRVDFSTGKPVANAEQAEQARRILLQFIDDLHTTTRFDEKQVYLVGFSQGGIMSYSAALTEPEKIKGIAVMSSRLLPEVKPLIASPERLAKLKLFVSHGTTDNVLSFQYALDAVEYVKTLGLHPEFHQYTDGHTINAQMLADLVKWLQ